MSRDGKKLSKNSAAQKSGSPGHTGAGASPVFTTLMMALLSPAAVMTSRSRAASTGGKEFNARKKKIVDLAQERWKRNGMLVELESSFDASKKPPTG